jgi:AsmA protein
MSRVLKSVAIALVVILLGVLGVALYIVTTIDANSYKPQIEQAAKKQQIELDIRGDLSLSIFPKLALNIGETHFSSDEYQIPPSSLESAALSLDLLALLRKQVSINALELNRADIHLTRLEQATAIAATSPGSGGEVESSSGDFAVAIDSISIVDSSFTLHGDEDQTRITHLNLSSSDINTRGDWFPVDTRFDYGDDGSALTLSLKTDARFDQSGQSLSLKDAAATIDGLAPKTLSLKLDADVDLAAQNATITHLVGNLGNFDFDATATVESLDNTPRAQGTLSLTGKDMAKSIGELSGKELVTASPEALKTLTFTTHFIASAKNLNLTDMALKLDSTDFTGSMLFRLASPRSMVLNLTGTTLNIDHYLPPPESEKDETSNELLLAPIIAPLAVLEGGKGSIRLKMDKLIAGGVEIDSPEMTMAASDKSVAISDLNLGVFGGNISAKVAIDAHGEMPVLSFSQQATALDIHQALEHFAENARMTGTLTLSMRGTSRGGSKDDLLNNLLASGDLAIKDPHLASVNLEQSYCELAAMVERTPKREEPWPDGTDLNDLSSQYRFNGPILDLTQYTTGVGNLKLRGNGTINLDKETFNIKAITRLEGDTTSDVGCTVKSRRVRNKDLALICKDSFSKAGATSCKPDPDLLKDLLKDELIDKFLDDSEDGEADPVKGLLKGLFNR